MKTKSLLLALVAFLMLSQIPAMAHDNGKSKFSKKIQAMLNSPKNMKGSSKTEKVTVCFVVNENGDVTEAAAKTTNNELRQDLQRQFMNMNLKGLSPCVTHSIDVNFLVK